MQTSALARHADLAFQPIFKSTCQLNLIRIGKDWREQWVLFLRQIKDHQLKSVKFDPSLPIFTLEDGTEKELRWDDGKSFALSMQELATSFKNLAITMATEARVLLGEGTVFELLHEAASVWGTGAGYFMEHLEDLSNPRWKVAQKYHQDDASNINDEGVASISHEGAERETDEAWFTVGIHGH